MLIHSLLICYCGRLSLMHGFMVMMPKLRKGEAICLEQVTFYPDRGLKSHLRCMGHLQVSCDKIPADYFHIMITL